MSNLSWLNPTPHAIAMYASQPLSPATTQHSLPSGRYPLLGPDLHRLDRTSFAAGAHLLDDLVGAREQHGRNFKADRAGGWQVDDQFKPRVMNGRHPTRRASDSGHSHPH